MQEVRRHGYIPGQEIPEPREDEPTRTLSFMCVIPCTKKGCGEVKIIVYMHTGWVVDSDKVFWLDTDEETPEQLFEAGGEKLAKLSVLISEGHIAVHHQDATTFDVSRAH